METEKKLKNVHGKTYSAHAYYEHGFYIVAYTINEKVKVVNFNDYDNWYNTVTYLLNINA